jgi:predicted nucleic acid-binding protein
MRVLVDTSIWSLALRRGTSKEHELVRELLDLIRDVRVQIIGPIHQELLSGVKSQKQFETLKSYLSAFPDLPLETSDYEKAASGFGDIHHRSGF